MTPSFPCVNGPGRCGARSRSAWRARARSLRPRPRPHSLRVNCVGDTIDFFSTGKSRLAWPAGWVLGPLPILTYCRTFYFLYFFQSTGKFRLAWRAGWVLGPLPILTFCRAFYFFYFFIRIFILFLFYYYFFFLKYGEMSFRVAGWMGVGSVTNSDFLSDL